MSVTTTHTVAATDTLYSFFKQVVNRVPQQIAFKADGGQGKKYTYAEAYEIVNNLGRWLTESKFAEESQIGLISENRPEWGIAYLAIVAAGKTVVPIDANLKDDEIAHIVNHAGLKTIFTSVEFEASLRKLDNGLKMFSFTEGTANYWLRDLPDNNDPLGSIAKPDSVAVLIYTSGTTGAPKAVMLTHRNILSNLKCILNTFRFGVGDIFISILPLHHTFEATCGFLTPIMGGCTIVYARSLKSKDILEDIKNNGATIMVGVPLLYEKMYHAIVRGINKAPLSRRLLFKTLYAVSGAGWKAGKKTGKNLFSSLRDKTGLGTIRMFVSGGAAMPPHIAKFYNLIGFDFFQGYGMTECSPVISANRPDDIIFSSVGPPLAGVEVRIEDKDEHGVGEICVRGELVTPGYRDNPEETARLIRDGWLYTGDLGKFKGGHLYITGRKKNLIVSAAGKNIYPEQIEEKLLESNFVMESVIYGRTYDDKQGEEVRAIIVPDLEQFKAEFGMDPDQPDESKIRDTIDEVVRTANESMADFKRIKTFDIQIDELEKTSTKKVKRFLYK